MDALRLSIVVPTRNRCDLLRRTLPTVLGQDLSPGEYEVIVVSDGSTDGTVPFLAGLRPAVVLRVLDRPRGGLASARNAGITAARASLVLLLDDDMLCPPGLAREHIVAHAGGTTSVACGPTLTAFGSRPGLATDYARGWYASYAVRMTRQGGARSAYDVWVTSNCSASHALLKAHGGYDESFFYSEDRELALRLWAAGVPFQFLPTAAAHELYSKAAADVIGADAPRLGVSELQLCRKFPAYTRHSLLAGIVGPSRTDVFLRWVCTRSTFSPDLLLRPFFSLTEQFPSSVRMRGLGLRLLGSRMAVAALRAAASEAGSWAKLRRELQGYTALTAVLDRSGSLTDGSGKCQ